MASRRGREATRSRAAPYEFWRDPSLNTNYYFNIVNNQPKNRSV